MTIEQIKAVLEKRSFLYRVEGELQEQLERIFHEEKFQFKRECWLTRRDRVDFFFPGTGLALECKVKNRPDACGRQLRRYAAAPGVKEILLLSRRPMQFSPLQLSPIGKPVAFISLWKQSFAGL